MDIQRNASSITGVVDSTGAAIGNPGTTADTVLTLAGSGTANSAVFIYDNGYLLTQASVTINGTWRSTETVLPGQHVFTVRDELVGTDSPAWVITVGETATYEDFESHPEGALPIEVPVTFASGLVGFFRRPLVISEARIKRLDDGPPGWGEQCLTMNAYHWPRFNFDRLITSFKFSYSSDQGTGHEVVFYDANDAVIVTYTLPWGSHMFADVSLSKPCSYCTFIGTASGMNWIDVDNFEWR